MSEKKETKKKPHDTGRKQRLKTILVKHKWTFTITVLCFNSLLFFQVLRVWWLRDGQRLLSNATAGIIVSNQTLVLQVSRFLNLSLLYQIYKRKDDTSNSTTKWSLDELKHFALSVIYSPFFHRSELICKRENETFNKDALFEITTSP